MQAPGAFETVMGIMRKGDYPAAQRYVETLRAYVQKGSYKANSIAELLAEEYLRAFENVIVPEILDVEKVLRVFADTLPEPSRWRMMQRLLYDACAQGRVEAVSWVFTHSTPEQLLDPDAGGTRTYLNPVAKTDNDTLLHMLLSYFGAEALANISMDPSLCVMGHPRLDAGCESCHCMFLRQHPYHPVILAIAHENLGIALVLMVTLEKHMPEKFKTEETRKEYARLKELLKDV